MASSARAIYHQMPYLRHAIQVFGRRSAMLLSHGMFALGSALSGAAQNMNWLIAARSKRSVPQLPVVSLIPCTQPFKVQGAVECWRSPVLLFPT